MHIVSSRKDLFISKKLRSFVVLRFAACPNRQVHIVSFVCLLVFPLLYAVISVLSVSVKLRPQE